MSKKNIFVIHNHKNFSGAARSLGELMTKLKKKVDFIVICPKGVFVIEVKGGQVAREENDWISTDRFGKSHRLKESPWDQAHNGAVAIRDRVRETLRQHDSKPPSVVGFGVILADVSQEEDSPLKPEETNTTLFSRDVATPGFLVKHISMLARYRDEHFNGGGTKTRLLTSREIKHIRESLAGDYHYIESIAQRASDSRNQIRKLTQEQIQVLQEKHQEETIITHQN